MRTLTLPRLLAALFLLLGTAATAQAAGEGKPELNPCGPILNTAGEPNVPLANMVWEYRRASSDGDTYAGCIRASSPTMGVHHVIYEGGRGQAQFDVQIGTKGNTIIFRGVAPARTAEGAAHPSYAPDTFVCTAAGAALRCRHEDTAGNTDPDFDLTLRQ
jgi:hypothetical protein